jgi:hypothetical protein
MTSGKSPLVGVWEETKIMATSPSQPSERVQVFLDAANAFCVARFLYSAAGEKGLRFEKMLAIKVTREPTKQPSAVRPAAAPTPSQDAAPPPRAFVNRHEAKTASLRRASCAPIFYQHNAHKKVLAERRARYKSVCVCVCGVCAMLPLGALLAVERKFHWLKKL